MSLFIQSKSPGPYGGLSVPLWRDPTYLPALPLSRKIHCSLLSNHTGFLLFLRQEELLSKYRGFEFALSSVWDVLPLGTPFHSKGKASLPSGWKVKPSSLSFFIHALLFLCNTDYHLPWSSLLYFSPLPPPRWSPPRAVLSALFFSVHATGHILLDDQKEWHRMNASVWEEMYSMKFRIPSYIKFYKET